MAKLFCTNCSYKFEPKTEKTPTKCPYCDALGSIEEAKSAQDMLNDLSGENW